MNPTTLPRHELVGLHATVVDSPNADLVGVGGRVVDETTATLLVAGASGTKQVPKAAATLRFQLDDGTRVDVDGERLVARPARRTETTTPNQWR
ncbi:ribonuclease P protein component 1 [Halosegnis sp.]|uniref:ribonuclease P protein component 1 n=1 Tax=Halosegnis sp. TaxID=2864959 RepID=UPI0035D48B2E